MRTHVMRCLALMALMVSLLLVVPAPIAAQSPQPEPTVTVTINGEQRTVRVGERIPLPASARVPSAMRTQVCDTGHMTISVKSAPGMHQSGAVVRVLDPCELLIESVHTSSESFRPPDGGDFTPATPIQSTPEKTDAPMTPASTVTRNGWARIHYHEQVGITVTEATATLTYDDDGVRVFNARNPDGWC